MADIETKDKRSKTISITVTDELFNQIQRLSHMKDITVSEYGFRVISSDIERIKSDTMLYVDALFAQHK